MDEKDLQKVISEALEPVFEGLNDDRESLDEAYVAQQKYYNQATELLSQRTKDAHTEMYQNYVKKLNEVSAKLDATSKVDVDHESCEYRSLKRDEAFLANSVYLHELYFSNCFDPHSELFMDTLAYMRLQRDFGSFEHWQADFMACAAANREGWAICGYNTFLKRFVNTFVDSHDQGAMLGLIPVIVIDTWSHSFYRDYLKDRKSYVVAMMRELNWEVIEERFKRLEKVHEALK